MVSFIGDGPIFVTNIVSQIREHPKSPLPQIKMMAGLQMTIFGLLSASSATTSASLTASARTEILELHTKLYYLWCKMVWYVVSHAS